MFDINSFMARKRLKQKDIAKMLGCSMGVVASWCVNRKQPSYKYIVQLFQNGMTLNESVLEAMNCTNPYCNNAQVIVLPAAE